MSTVLILYVTTRRHNPVNHSRPSPFLPFSVAVPESTLALTHTRGLFNLFINLARLLWTSDQPVELVSIYTGQHDIESRGHISLP